MKIPETAFLEQSFIRLKGIDLEDSCLMGLEMDWEGQRLTLYLDFSIWPPSAFYEKPKPGEWTCYKRGVLVFTNVRELIGLPDLENISPSVDPDGSMDWGNLEGLCMDSEWVGMYLCESEVRFKTDEMVFRLE